LLKLHVDGEEIVLVAVADPKHPPGNPLVPVESLTKYPVDVGVVGTGRSRSGSPSTCEPVF
jgi:hypothetical protein